MNMLLFWISLKFMACHCVAGVKKKVNNSRVVKALHYLRNVLQVEWNNIPAHVIQRYVNSMWLHILEVIRQNGGYTRH